MPERLSGTGGGDKRTPTLRKWLTMNTPPEPEKFFFVRLCFDSNEYGSFTLVTEQFKLPIYENNPIFNDIKLLVAECADSQCGLAVCVTNPKSLLWDLVPVEYEVYEWNRTDWGWVAKHTGETRSQKTSNPTPKGRK